MSDTLECFGTEYTNVAGFKATDSNDNVLTYIRPQGNKAITANGTDIDVAAYATATVAVPQPSGTITISQAGNTDVTNYATASVPTASFYTGIVGTGYYTESNVRKWRFRAVTDLDISEGDTEGWHANGAQYSDYRVYNAVASGTTITPSTSSQTIGGANYMMEGAVTVSGDANLVAGNIKSGTTIFGVTGTYSGGSSKNVQAYLGYAQRTANSYGATTVTLTVAKTGTYKVSWTAWRGSSSGTMGTNLHKNSTAGTNQQTWTGTYGQNIVLNNQSLSANDVLTVWATSGSNSRSVYVGNLIIEEQ